MDKLFSCITTVVSKIIDMNTFTNKIIEERQIKKPKLVLGAEGSTSKCIVAGMILDADEALHYSLDGFHLKR